MTGTAQGIAANEFNGAPGGDARRARLRQRAHVEVRPGGEIRAQINDRGEKDD